LKKRFSAVGLVAICVWGISFLMPHVRASQPAAQGDLTPESLQKMLGDMGYSPKKLSIGYLISISRDSWTFHIQLVLSKDGSKLGMNSNLGAIPKPEEVAASTWLRLLEANGDVDPSAFYVDKQTQKLYLHRTLDNRGITPAILRGQIEAFCSNTKDTGKLWEFTK
jgi:hypothetical protein